MSPASRHSPPLLVREGQPPLKLERLSLGVGELGGQRREEFIQELVHGSPDIIPMADIEPAFSPLLSVCRELETPAGFLDNLWLTPSGGLVLGECKLVRNPQTRREVLSQALDYARAVSAWHYEELENAAIKAGRGAFNSLWHLVREQTDLDEAQFVDAVERRLRSSRFVVLIIGDGIQEGTEALTTYLQLHAGLHVTLALVEISFWHGIEDGLLIVPRVPLRTVLVERGIVRILPMQRSKLPANKPLPTGGPILPRNRSTSIS